MIELAKIDPIRVDIYHHHDIRVVFSDERNGAEQAEDEPKVAPVRHGPYCISCGECKQCWLARSYPSPCPDPISVSNVHVWNKV